MLSVAHAQYRHAFRSVVFAIAALLAIALLTFGGSSYRASAAADATISGTVALPDGVPASAMNGVIVYASPLSPSLDSTGRYAMTNPDPRTGEYTLSGLADGQYVVEFYAVSVDGNPSDLIREF